MELAAQGMKKTTGRESAPLLYRREDDMKCDRLIIERSGGNYTVRPTSRSSEASRDWAAIVIVLIGLIAVAVILQ